MNFKRIGLGALLSVALLFAVAEPALAQSVNAELINELNAKLLYVAIPITLLVEVILIYTVWRFANNDDPKPTRENRRLEITWTIATAIILLFVGLAAFTVLGSPYISLVPDATQSAQAQPQAQSQQANVLTDKPGATAPPQNSDAVEIEVIAFQWGWEFVYPEAGVNSSTTLAIPNGTDVYFHITSRDVIHAVHAPTLGLKQDALPGQYNTIKTKATQSGSYQLYCAEFCGSGHSRMLANLTVMPQDEYRSWLDEQRSGNNSSNGSSNASSSLGDVSVKPTA